ncbi:hypothetical protein ACM66B_005351 [Microbotryomycetes sp. NB124-2]
MSLFGLSLLGFESVFGSPSPILVDNVHGSLEVCTWSEIRNEALKGCSAILRKIQHSETEKVTGLIRSFFNLDRLQHFSASTKNSHLSVADLHNEPWTAVSSSYRVFQVKLLIVAFTTQKFFAVVVKELSASLSHKLETVIQQGSSDILEAKAHIVLDEAKTYGLEKLTCYELTLILLFVLGWTGYPSTYNYLPRAQSKSTLPEETFREYYVHFCAHLPIGPPVIRSHATGTQHGHLMSLSRPELSPRQRAVYNMSKVTSAWM